MRTRGTTYKQVSLIPPGGATLNSVKDLGCKDLVPEIGITGTPVIDTSSGTIYLIASGKVGGTIVQYLHALDVITLSEKFGGPVLIQATVPGKAADGNGSTVSFNAAIQLQRPALLLEHGHVIMGWGSHCDFPPWHGWLMSYNASTLAQEAAFLTTPNGDAGGIWLSGADIAADSSGDIYIVTGNGTWNGTTDYGDSIVKLGPPSGGKFPVLDYFTPYNQAFLDANDLDLGSGGLVLLPPLAAGSLVAQQGKSGTIVLTRANNLGKYCPNLSPACSGSDTNVIQEITGASGALFGTPAYWNGNIYWGGSGNNLRAYSFNAGGSGKLSTTPTSQSTQSFAYAAPVPAVSANGNSDGIVWALSGSADDSTCSTGTCLGLFAYDATNLGNLLWSSSQSANNYPGPGVKFAAPMVANGKVYVGTQTGLAVYGLLSSPPTAATPSFTPSGGSYNTVSLPVTISDATPGTTIYYTTNGSTPGTGSTRYNGPVSLTSTTVLQAIAAGTGYNNSAVATATYTISTSATTPVSVSLAGSANVNAFVNDGTGATSGGLDGAGNAFSANLLGSSLASGGATFTLGAAGTLNSVANKTIALPAGNYSALNLLATAANGNQPNKTITVTYTDGTTSVFTQSFSDWFTPQTYAGETQALAMTYRVSPSGSTSGGTWYVYSYSFALNSAKTVASVTLPGTRNVVVLAIDLTPSGGGTTPTAATPTFSVPGGNYTSAQSVSISDSTPGNTIYYTTNGSTPGTGSTRYTGAITLSTTTQLRAIAVASGYNNSAIASATYTISTSGGGTPVSVPLGSIANVEAIGINGAAVTSGGLDGSSYAFSATLLGSSLSWAGSTFSFGTAGALDAAANKTITLPAGSYSALSLLATAVNTNQPNQTVTVTYTDGSTSVFTQGFSDWGTPQNYAGESTALSMAYRLTPTGATAAGPWYLFGYSFALNSAKTVASVKLPATRNVIVLAIDLTPSGGGTTPTAATPTFSVPGGNYTSAQSVTIADSTPGSVIYYTTNGSTPGTGSTQYTGAISISATTQLQAIAIASGYNNSAVASATYTISTSGGGTPVSVPLTSVANVEAIGVNGAAVTSGGLDGSSYAFSSTLLGSSLSWAGSTFTFGNAGALDAAANKTVTLPAGSYNTLYLLATAVYGNQANQSITVTYTDGTTSVFTQSFSDWGTPQNYAGESTALSMAYRLTPTGATAAGPWYLFGYSFAINSAKTVASVKLPATRSVIVLAIDLR